MNPYIINPSYAGTDGRASLFLTYRKQWVDIEGAPTIGNFSFHTPTGKNVGLGLNFTNAERSVLNTTSGYLTLSYGVWFSDKVALRFGFSGGVAYNGVDIDELENISTDPALAELLDQNLYLIGNAGLSLQIHRFNLGVSAPNLFNDEFTAQEDFTQGEFQPLENLTLLASNRFYFDKEGKFIFEPFVLYRYSDVLPHQLEASGVFHISNVVWLGGTYKQDFGITGFGGIKISKLFGVGYAYSLKNTGSNEINSPTHEIQLNLLLGGRNKKRMVYSFVDTSIPKQKSKRQLAQEQKQAEAEEKKRLRAEQLKKVEEEKKAEEAERKRVEEEHPEQERKEVEEAAAQVDEVDEEINDEEAPQVEEKPEPVPEGNLNDQLTTEDRIIVKSGSHLLELSSGEYVVVGAFSRYEHAEKFSDELFFKGYQSKFGYITQEGYWYVYLSQSNSIGEAREKRDEFRKSAFPNAWVLSVQ